MGKGSEPTAKVEEVKEGEFPSRETRRGERLSSRKGGLDQVFIPLELQDFNRFGLGVDEPHFPDTRLGIEVKFRRSIVGRRGRGKNFDHQIRSSLDVVFLNDLRVGMGNENQVRLKCRIDAQADIERGKKDMP